MKILHLLHRFPPESLGGTEVNTWQIAREQSRRHRVLVLYASSRPPKADAAFPTTGFEVEAVAPPDWPLQRKLFEPLPDDPRCEEEVIARVHRFGPDLVHLHHLQNIPPGAVDRLLREGMRVLWRLQDFWPICARSHLTRVDGSFCAGPDPDLRNCERCRHETVFEKLGLPPSLSPPFLSMLPIRKGLLGRFHRMRDLLNRTELNLCPSEFLLETYARHGVRREALRLLRDGLEESAFAGFRRQPSPQFRFSCLGTIAPHKGTHTAVEAFRKLSRPDVTLTIHGPFSPGSVPYHEALRRAAPPGVRFAGRFENSAVPLAETDCVIVPSLCLENCPAAVLQALATRTPVLGSDLGGIPELLREGGGLLFPAGDPEALRNRMEEILAPGAAEILAKNSRPPAGLRDYVEALDRIYEERP